MVVTTIESRFLCEALPLQLAMLRQGGRTPWADPQTPGGDGAAAAAGVLTAVDEDGEGEEDATIPNAFEYFTDSDDEDED